MNKSVENTTTGFWPGCSAPSFEAPVVFSGTSAPTTMNLQLLRGSNVVMIFYPMDLGYICPTELTMLDDYLNDFQEENCEVLAISTSSILSKQAFLSLDKEQGGVKGLRIGLVEDKTGDIGHMYGVMKEDGGYTYRAIVIIDSEGMVLSRSVSDLPIGCGIKEALRIIRKLNGQDEEKENNSGNEMDEVKSHGKANMMNEASGEKPEAITVEKTDKNDKSAKEAGDNLDKPESTNLEKKEEAAGTA